MGKIMKYEFRSMFRLFLPMWLGILALSLVNRFTVKLQFGNEPVLNFLTGLTMFLYVVGIMAVVIVAFIFVILRFYRGVLRDEGYLTMTLPVSVDAVIWGKALAGWILMVLTTVVCIASGAVLLLTNEVVWVFQLSWDRLLELIGSTTPTLIAVQVVLSALLSTLYNILFLYLAMAIGHLSRKHRVGASVLAYVVMSTVLSTIYNTFLTPAILNFMMGYGFDRMTNQEIVAMISNGLWIYLAAVVVACAVFYVPTRIILDKKLNLE